MADQCCPGPGHPLRAGQEALRNCPCPERPSSVRSMGAPGCSWGRPGDRRRSPKGHLCPPPTPAVSGPGDSGVPPLLGKADVQPDVQLPEDPAASLGAPGAFPGPTLAYQAAVGRGARLPSSYLLPAYASGSCPPPRAPPRPTCPSSRVYVLMCARVTISTLILHTASLGHTPGLVGSSESRSVVSNSLQPHGLGILQARILEWVAFPLSGGSSQPRGHPGSALQADSLPAEPPGKPRTPGRCPFCSWAGCWFLQAPPGTV